jgi:hypothetical protein
MNPVWCLAPRAFGLFEQYPELITKTYHLSALSLADKWYGLELYRRLFVVWRQIMTIAIVGMLDEREAGLTLIKDHIEQKGHRTLLIDISIGTGAIDSALKADITCDEVALAGGTTIEAVRKMLAKERDKATSTVAEGLGKKLLDG